MTKSRFFILSIAAAMYLVIEHLHAADMIIDPNGGAYRTIQSAITAAQAGDRIVLSSKQTYRERLLFNNKKGTPEKPIIIEGNGACIDGSDSLVPEEWIEVKPRIFRSTKLPERLKFNGVAGMIMRYYFLFGTDMVRMDRISKGPQPKFKAVEDLKEDEWCYADSEKAFYIRISEKRKLEDVRVPVRDCGVAFRGSCENLVIRKLRATHVWNDGFNIHGYSRNILFENIEAIECGDDGISAHDDCQIIVKGLTSAGNATGFCHVGRSKSDSSNVQLIDNLAYGVFVVDESEHKLINCVIKGSKGISLRALNGADIHMQNIVLLGEADSEGSVSIEKSKLDGQGIFSWNQKWSIGESSSCVLIDSVISTKKFDVDEKAAFKSDKNIWSIGAITFNKQKFVPDRFAEYQKASGQDAGSSCVNLSRQEFFKKAESVDLSHLYKDLQLYKSENK